MRCHPALPSTLASNASSGSGCRPCWPRCCRPGSGPAPWSATQPSARHSGSFGMLRDVRGF
eukprot:11213956-Lingulodinium_polyedra.AAC.1